MFMNIYANNQIKAISAFVDVARSPAIGSPTNAMHVKSPKIMVLVFPDFIACSFLGESNRK